MTNNNVIKAPIYAIGKLTLVGAKSASKIEVVLEYIDPKFPAYPQLLPFEFFGDKAALIDAFSVGDLVIVSYELRGRKWTDPKTGADKYFPSLSAWKIEPAVTDAPAKVQGAVAAAPAPQAEEEDGVDDDLPF